MKVMTIVGTRPELIRLSRTIDALDSNFEHVLVHTGQNYDYELNKIFFEDLCIPEPQFYLEAAAENVADSIANIISKSDRLLRDEKPDALLVLGDTNSALSVIPAKRRKIPIFHMEAGNRCFDQRVPEETNRTIVDHTSDINLAYSMAAKQNLLREGLPMDRVLKIGSPMYEVLDYYQDRIAHSDALERLGLAKGEYFVLSSHREENVDDPRRLESLVACTDAILANYPYPILFSIHPRTQKRIEQLGATFSDRVLVSKPFSFTDYIRLEKDAFCVVSDSGTITEESAILDFPAVNIRDSHERIEGMENGAVVMTGLEPELLLLGIQAARRQAGRNERLLDVVDDYVRKNVSETVCRIILSYTDYVNKRIWFK